MAIRNTNSIAIGNATHYAAGMIGGVLPSMFSMASLCSLPNILAEAKPVPNSIPLTAGMANTAWLNTDSTESKKGSPNANRKAIYACIPQFLQHYLLHQWLFASPFSTSVSPPTSVIVASTLYVIQYFFCDHPCCNQANG